VVAGETSSKGAGEKDLWVIKLDHQGDMIWDRTYGGSDEDRAYSLIQTTDGGYAVAGATLSKGAGSADLWVIKLDHQGDMIWDRTYGGSDDDYALSLIQTTDGGYAVAGLTDSKGAGKSDFWVIKLDHQGNKTGSPGQYDLG
jgi:predicted secreted protein